jgi:hypothetical protein
MDRCQHWVVKTSHSVVKRSPCDREAIAAYAKRLTPYHEQVCSMWATQRSALIKACVPPHRQSTHQHPKHQMLMNALFTLVSSSWAIPRLSTTQKRSLNQ